MDYYPFGMQMEGRFSNTPAYRYGFNGKEKDDEVKGVGGTQYDYGFRIYDPRMGKFLSVDPLTGNYPMLTPYQFASDNPIKFIDLDGRESVQPQTYSDAPKITVPTCLLNAEMQYEQTSNQHWALYGAVEFLQNQYRYFTHDIWHKETYIDLAGMYFSPVISPELAIEFDYMSGSNSSQMFYWGMQTGQWPELSNKENFKLGLQALLMLSPLASKIKVPSFGRASFDPAFFVEDNVLSDPRQWYRYKGKQVGFYRGYKSGFEIEINLEPELQNIGIGSEIFKRAVNDNPYSSFYAKWVKSDIYATGSSVNLDIYNAGIKKGLTPEQAAWTTWSGRQAKANGFNHVDVTSIENGISAEFCKVE